MKQDEISFRVMIAWLESEKSAYFKYLYILFWKMCLTIKIQLNSQLCFRYYCLYRGLKKKFKAHIDHFLLTNDILRNEMHASSLNWDSSTLHA